MARNVIHRQVLTVLTSGALWFGTLTSACGGNDSANGGTGGTAAAGTSAAGTQTGGTAAGGAAQGGMVAEGGLGGDPGLGQGGTITGTGGESAGAGGESAGAGGESAGAGGESAGAGGEVVGGAGGGSVGTGGTPRVPDAPIQVAGVVVSTVTGTAGDGLTNGTLDQARFHNPANLAIVDQKLYLTDYDNSALRVIDLATGAVSTRYTALKFCQPFGVVAGGPGELFVETDCSPNSGTYAADRDGTIWRFDTTTTDPPVLVHQPNGRPRGLLYLPADAQHASARLVFSDLVNHTISVLDLATNTATLLAGSAGNYGFVNGVGENARFRRPYGLALWQGDVVVCDAGNRVVRRVAWDGTVTTLAGTGQEGLVDGPAATAVFAIPQDIAADTLGNLFITDSGSHRIRVIHNGTVQTLAGSSWDPAYEDGDGTVAKFFGQEGLDVTADGRTLYLADGDTGEPYPNYSHIRKIEVPVLP